VQEKIYLVPRIESLLSARFFIAPQLVGNHIFFISNLRGHLSLYVKEYDNNTIQPLLPGSIALPRPDLLVGQSYAVFPQLESILVILDQDGNEAYQPMYIPVAGGEPQPAFGEQVADYNVQCQGIDRERNLAYLWASSPKEPLSQAYRANLVTGELVKLAESQFGGLPIGFNATHTKTVILETLGVGDHIITLNDGDQPKRQLLYGVPVDQRQPGQIVSPNSINHCHFVNDDRAILCTTSLFSDTYGLGYMELVSPGVVQPLTITGAVHKGMGELDGLEHLRANRYLISYNIDGCSWLYEGSFDLATLTMKLDNVLCGQGQLANGVLQGYHYDKESDRYVLSFTTATFPPQIYTVAGNAREQLTQHTDEPVDDVPETWFSAGEDASFTSYDGLRISARLYFPSQCLNFTSPHPLVYFVHGGPQSQERPEFIGFSVPFIQFLTLNGFAVFVPNVRGSTGYGFAYMNHVLRDWGGADRLDHVHAMREVLPQDKRLDLKRAAVVGASYGGYMALTLASRHSEFWSAAAAAYGPYDLISFAERVPEAWKPFVAYLIGDPVKDRDFLIERSPSTYLDQIACPLLIIQGKNDPRIVATESRELVEKLRQLGKEVTYIVLEDEGHGILKLSNRIRSYNSIVDLFKKYLQP
jgi:pimeloyl-ACP methyl ester carboxylesterase